MRDALSFIQDLMTELDEKEGVFKSVQDKGEQLIHNNHPARATIEVSPSRCRQSGCLILTFLPIFNVQILSNS